MFSILLSFFFILLWFQKKTWIFFLFSIFVFVRFQKTQHLCILIQAKVKQTIYDKWQQQQQQKIYF